MLFHAQVAEGIFLISSDISGPDSDGRSLKPGRATANSYLVVGEDKALLFDLAVNEPGVVNYVRRQTNRFFLFSATGTLTMCIIWRIFPKSGFTVQIFLC